MIADNKILVHKFLLRTELEKENKNCELEHYLSMRGNSKAYMHLCTNYLPCVVGKKQWDDASRDGPMSEIADETDEAFLLLVLENSWLVWKQLAEYPKGELPLQKDRMLPKYTGTPAGSGRNEGWGDLGTKRYNQLCKRVELDRKENGTSFDREYLLKRQEECRNQRKRKSMSDEGAVRKEAPYWNPNKLKKVTEAAIAARKKKQEEENSETENESDSDSSLEHARRNQEIV